ncbi:GTPase-activating protein SAC7 [Madurella mycetomatis]|uniref:GTPase-activating protein SAC7 n=1 Tax=Madurella mycetomatis TaxID=100816 RepID=A0A175WGI8_9PEZI|nr:GTPase-activating protein SAC7 [Madurella mycetomatis]KXX82908.1 GTPase-activating protein SAC7 [Madurella mycetomatis]
MLRGPNQVPEKLGRKAVAGGGKIHDHCPSQSFAALTTLANQPADRPQLSPVDDITWLHDGRSVNAGCFAASNAIARTSLALTSFVREVRESRAELDALSTELHSLDGLLDLLKDDVASFPAALAEQTPNVLHTCLALIGELEGCISILDRPGVSRADKRSRWLASRDHIGSLRWTLAVYKSALGLAVDLVGVMNSQADGSHASSLPGRQHDVSAEDTELATVAGRIIQTTDGLQKDLRQNAALTKLKEYLDILHSETCSLLNHHESRHRGHRRGGCSSLGGAPDSAIDISYDESPSSPSSSRQASRRPPKSVPLKPWKEMDEFDGELNEMPVRAPPPPPRSIARLGSSTALNALASRPNTANSTCYGMGVASELACSRSPSSSTFTPTGIVQHRPVQERYHAGATTELSPRLEALSFRSGTSSPSGKSSILDQAHYPLWENPRTEVPVPGRPATSSSRDRQHQGGQQHGDHDRASALNRSSSKFSKTLRSIGFRRPSMQGRETSIEVEATAVFGVPLAQSMKVAKGIASTRHAAGGTSVRATRDYPLCVLRCVYYIRDCGLEAPHIFGLDGDQLRLAQLKEIFNSTTTNYGKELDWSRFSVYDAADLILLFLSELPKPLISESVGKRWVALSRQATVRGSLSMRLDQGLDFWEEAFLGINGPARSLFKLLLNLWGDITDAAQVNDMTAERLAGRVMRPLMHVTTARYQTDFLLGLAFMIRKRSEYNLAARDLGQKSNTTSQS